MRKTVFNNCNLQETSFVDADVSESRFIECDLSLALFQNTNLEKSDFETSYNYSINPELNKIKKAKFAISGLPGLLLKYDIEIV